MKTNDIKSGYKIQLHNGWFGTIKDNKKGNTRMCEVEGIYTEIGSIYSHDIKKALEPINNKWHDIEYTKEQIKLKSNIDSKFINC
jgi:hypothetical protein